MGIDAEDIKLCVCRIFHLSLRASHIFVQKHPYVSGTLLFLFILYIFLPSVFSFLFYCLPFLGLTGVLLAFWTSKRSTIRVEKVEDKKLEVSKRAPVTINRNRSAYLRNATSRRQRFKERTEAWRTEAPINASVGRTNQPFESDNSKSLIEVKETRSLDSGNNESVHCTSVDKANEISRKREPFLGSKLLGKSDVVVFDGSSSQTNKSDSGGDETKNESSEDPEDEDEEEAQEDRNKAVEWTEDDQKNLMDLGLSEIERNRRLENLIARRRARKSYKRKNEDNALTTDIRPVGQIPKIITTKNDPLEADGCKDAEGVPMPGSAPSVLLPMRNPFDLPYDPHEEKPNLMADSFQQEFTAAHQKELAFCRHESFCFGPAYPEESGAMGYHPRYRRPSISIADKGEHDWLIEQLLFKGDQVSRSERKPIATETRGMQTEVLPQTKDVNAMELESDQGKEMPPDSESEFEMEPELTQDGNSQSSHSSDNPVNVTCDDVRVVSKSFESTLSSALNKTLNCRVPKNRLIKEPLYDFSPTAIDKSKMEERFSYSDKVACHTPTYSIASDLQVEVSEIGSPPTIDGNNTDGESLNPDWEIEKEANFGGEQDYTSPLLDGRFNEVVLDVQEEEVKPFSVTEALPLPPKTIQNPMSEESLDHLSRLVPQIPEEMSFPTYDDEEAISQMADQKSPEALESMKNLVKTSEDVDDGLEISIKQEDNGKQTRPMEETCVKSSRSLNDGSEDSSGSQAHLFHEHSEGSKNKDQITGNGDLGQVQEHSEQGSKLMDQITSSEDLGWAHKHPEEGSENKDKIIGNEDLGLAQKHSEEDSRNMDQITGNGHLGWAHEHSEEGSINTGQNMDQITGNGHLGWAHEHSEEGSKNTGQIIDSGDLVEPRKIELQLEFMQDHKNQPDVVETELQSSKDDLKLPVDEDFVPSGGEPLVSLDTMCFDASIKQVNDVQSESQNSNSDLLEPRKGEEPLELKQDNKNQPNVVEIEFQSSKDASKSTVEDDLASDGGVPLHSNDILGSGASQNQANAVQHEFQKSDNAMKPTAGQDSVIETELPDTNRGLFPESSMEEQIHVDKVFLSQDFIVESSLKTTEKDDNKLADSVEVGNEFVKDLSEQKGEKSNLDVKDDRLKTDQNLSSPNSELNDLKISEIIVPEEVAQGKEFEVGDKKIEYESHNKFNKQESDIVEEKDLEFDKDMESYSKDLNGPFKLRANVMGLKKPSDLAHESPLDSSLIADK